MTTNDTSATTSHTPPANLDGLTNYVEVVGYLERGGRANAAKVVARRYSEKGAAVDQLRIQVLDAGGTVAYGMRLAVPALLRQQMGDAMVTLTEGQRIKVWGQLNRPVSYDGRYRDPKSADPDSGREYRELVVEVQGMALASAADIDGTLVVLQGQVLTPPYLGPHETDVNLEVARTTLECRWTFNSRPDRPAMVEVKNAAFPIEVPLLLDNAAAVFAPENVVRIEGRLEAYVELLDPARAPNPVRRRRGGGDAPNSVAEALVRLDAAWESQQTTLSGADYQKAERDYYRRRQMLQQERSLRVRAGYVQLLQGAVISQHEARKQRAERLTKRRVAAARRRGDTTVASGAAQTLAEATAQHAVAMDAAAEPARTNRPARSARLRRRTELEMATAVVEDAAHAEVLNTAVDGSSNGHAVSAEPIAVLPVMVES